VHLRVALSRRVFRRAGRVKLSLPPYAFALNDQWGQHHEYVAFHYLRYRDTHELCAALAKPARCHKQRGGRRGRYKPSEIPHLQGDGDSRAFIRGVQPGRRGKRSIPRSEIPSTARAGERIANAAVYPSRRGSGAD
jgi:hypothetical protein